MKKQKIPCCRSNSKIQLKIVKTEAKSMDLTLTYMTADCKCLIQTPQEKVAGLN